MLKMVELMPTALASSSLPTISTTNDCRIGVSIGGDQPEHGGQHEHVPVLHDAGDVEQAEHQRDEGEPGLGREQQPALVAAVGEHPAPQAEQSDGPNCSAVTMPSAVPELVSSSTSQSWATRCIQVPVSETSWPQA